MIHATRNTQYATREVKIGNVTIGGNNPVAVQSMTKTDTRDIKATIAQIKELERAGCELIRLAVPDMAAADALKSIKPAIEIPIVADIHFDHRLALRAIENGVDKLRINPGNIGDRDKVVAVIQAAKDRKIPIRVGVNAGSLEKELVEKYGRHSPEALVQSAMRHVELLEEMDFFDIVVALKSSDVVTMIESYRLMAEMRDYPLHLGVTEAGTLFRGSIKSAIGIGVLLEQGIGDTIRVSLTTDPVNEVFAAYEILKSLGLRQHGVDFVSCPMCGRCEIDLIGIAKKIERHVKMIDLPLKIAVMGCVVNGPGEARDADLGLAGGKGMGLIFKKGEKYKKVNEDEMVDVFIDEIDKMLKG